MNVHSVIWPAGPAKNGCKGIKNSDCISQISFILSKMQIKMYFEYAKFCILSNLVLCRGKVALKLWAWLKFSS